MTSFTIIRHGSTKGIEQGLLQGSSDSRLSARGRRQAEMTAGLLSRRRISNCFCSPLGRTRETASIICKPLGLEPVVLEDLREYDFGCLEGHRYFGPPRRDSTFFEKFRSLARLTLAGLSGETLSHIRRRAGRVWQHLMSLQLEGENLVISHGFFINIFIQEIFKPSGQMPDGFFDVGACSLTTIEVRHGIPVLVKTNDISHLGVEWSWPLKASSGISAGFC
jgi:broad specificity phosphatase PhoE